jgi:hypothetical protein
MVSKILYLATCCCVNSNFLKPCKATVGITVIFSELFVDFRSSKAVEGFGKRASLTARLRSLDFRYRSNFAKVTIASRYDGSFKKCNEA